jgi:hypothetical protein
MLVYGHFKLVRLCRRGPDLSPQPPVAFHDYWAPVAGEPGGDRPQLLPGNRALSRESAAISYRKILRRGAGGERCR